MTATMNIGTTMINEKGDSMKKIIALILTAVFCFIIAACNNETIFEKQTTTKGTVVTAENIVASDITESKEGSPVETKTQQNVDQGGGELLPRKYRNNYYQIPTFFAKIVDDAVYSEWEKEYYANNYPDNTNVMVMVDFIKEFNVSKEEFERANLEYAKFMTELYSHICLDPQDYADQEMQEIYNADIIYTFDNEIINEYYLGIDYPFLNEYQYVEALEAGTYETRTTQFITVEQMEADIIAKYGEAEIETTVTAEATVTAESTEAVTDIPEATVPKA